MASGSSNNGALNIGSENRRAILFCNEPDKTDPLGMLKDSVKIEKILKEHKFNVSDQSKICHPNLTAANLFEKLKAFCDENINASCLLVIILTHGNETVLQAEGGSYEIDMLFSTISTDKNKNIPKIVFIDACQGNECDDGFVVTLDTTDGKSDQTLITQSQLPPNLLVACAATPVYQSFADEDGSSFVDQICYLLGKTDDFMSSLTVANYEVSKLAREVKKSDQDKTFEVVKHMPIIISNLTSKLYLMPLSGDQTTATGPVNPFDKVTSPTTARANIKEREHKDNYNMSYGKKGLVVILNDSKTDKNRVNYKELFKKLGSFDVEEYTIEDKLTKTLQKVASEPSEPSEPSKPRNHDEYSCFVCCIAAKYTDTQPSILFPPYWKDDMQEYFGNDTCNFFVGKPKIFFMHLEENGTQSIPDGGDETDGKVQIKVRIPRAADILIYSVKENFSSEPHPTTSAAQISEKLKSAQVTKKDVVTALTEASQSITQKEKPTPTIFSTLTGKIFL